MRTMPIRMRLTLWYFGIFALSLAGYATAMLLATRATVHAVIDDELRTRMQGVRQMIERFDPSVALPRLQEELREHSGLRPGGDLLQVRDPAGAWLFQSRSIRGFNVEPMNAAVGERYETIISNGQLLRVLSAPISAAGRAYMAQVASPVDEAEAILGRFRWLLLLSLPVVLALACGVGYWMSRRALAPVEAITEAARSVTTARLSRRLELPRTADELHRLTATFNDMLARLESGVAQITRFTADASHELRTPVALVRTTAELSLRRPRDAEAYREALAQILSETERMTRLIDDLLTLARIDAGAEQLKFELLDAGALLRDATGRCEPLAEAKNVRLEKTIPDRRILVHTDGRALERLFIILIDNAIRYTPAAGRVGVRLDDVDGAAIVTIEDTGMGIPADAIDRIFERFYRVDAARSREAGGAGLGLSIAKWIVDAHNGSIRVESHAGIGSVFEVRFPRRIEGRQPTA